MDTLRSSPGGLYWIASYPKSGNTWVRLFAATLRYGADIDIREMDGTGAMASGRWLIERHLDLNVADLAADEAAELRPLAYRALVASTSSPRFCKVHDAWGQTQSGAEIFPAEVTLGCIHVVRDPRDVCLSLAAHNAISIDAAIEELADVTAATSALTKRQLRELRGSWSSHTASWERAPLRRLTLRYEDLVADPLTHFSELASFCGFDVDREDIASAIAATRFDKLAADEALGGFRERPDGMGRFFREGRAGQWRDVLTVGQARRIERDHQSMMAHFGYEL